MKDSISVRIYERCVLCVKMYWVNLPSTLKKKRKEKKTYLNDNDDI